MIGNKYGKVIILALINILAVCFVYNNVATDNSNIVLGQVEEGEIVKDTAEVLKHVDQTNISDRKVIERLNIDKAVSWTIKKKRQMRVK